MPRYWFQLVRPRFETALISIDADDYEEANQTVEFGAMFPGPKWRLEPFDEDHYTPFPIFGISEKELLMDGDTLAAGKRWLRQTSQEDNRFLILVADMETGEGFVPEQPWLPAGGELILTDIGGDWIAGIDRRINEPVPDPNSTPPDNVIPFRRRAKTRSES